MSTRAFAYYRISTAEQAGLDRQRAAVRAYAAREGLELAHESTDAAELLRHVTPDVIVLVDGADRLSRTLAALPEGVRVVDVRHEQGG